MPEIESIKIYNQIETHKNISKSITTSLENNLIEIINLEEELTNETINQNLQATATIVLTGTSILSGIAKFVEKIDDGLIWVEGKINSKIFDIIGYKDIANSIIESTQTEIARDKVAELNNFFYENTKLGQTINEKSYIKYNSETATKIQNISTKVTEYIVATGTVVVTGGTITPIAIGVLFGIGGIEGIGQSAENRYKENNNDNNLILIDGIAGGLSMVGNGLTYNALNKFIKYNLSMYQTGTKGIARVIFSNRFFNTGNILETGGLAINHFTNNYSNKNSNLMKEIFKEYTGGLLIESFIGI